MTAPSPRRRYRRHDPAARRHVPLVTDTEDHDPDSDLIFPSPKWADDAWDWFRRRPLWQQLAGWLLGFWVLAVIVFWRSGLPPRWKQNLTVVWCFAVVVIGGTAIITLAVDQPERYTPPRAAATGAPIDWEAVRQRTYLPSGPTPAAYRARLARWVDEMDRAETALRDRMRRVAPADATWQRNAQDALARLRMVAAIPLDWDVPPCLLKLHVLLTGALDRYRAAYDPLGAALVPAGQGQNVTAQLIGWADFAPDVRYEIVIAVAALNTESC